MPETTRTSMSLRPDQVELLEDLSENDDPRIDDRSEATRHIIDEWQQQKEQIDDLERQIESKENQIKVLSDRIDDLDENETDMVPTEDSTSITSRLKWLFTGK